MANKRRLPSLSRAFRKAVLTSTAMAIAANPFAQAFANPTKKDDLFGAPSSLPTQQTTSTSKQDGVAPVQSWSDWAWGLGSYALQTTKDSAIKLVKDPWEAFKNHTSIAYEGALGAANLAKGLAELSVATVTRDQAWNEAAWNDINKGSAHLSDSWRDGWANIWQTYDNIGKNPLVRAGVSGYFALNFGILNAFLIAPAAYAGANVLSFMPMMFAGPILFGSDYGSYGKHYGIISNYLKNYSQTTADWLTNPILQRVIFNRAQHMVLNSKNTLANMLGYGFSLGSSALAHMSGNDQAINDAYQNRQKRWDDMLSTAAATVRSTLMPYQGFTKEAAGISSEMFMNNMPLYLMRIREGMESQDWGAPARMAASDQFGNFFGYAWDRQAKDFKFTPPTEDLGITRIPVAEMNGKILTTGDLAERLSINSAEPIASKRFANFFTTLDKTQQDDLIKLSKTQVPTNAPRYTYENYGFGSAIADFAKSGWSAFSGYLLGLPSHIKNLAWTAGKVFAPYSLGIHDDVLSVAQPMADQWLHQNLGNNWYNLDPTRFALTLGGQYLVYKAFDKIVGTIDPIEGSLERVLRQNMKSSMEDYADRMILNTKMQFLKENPNISSEELNRQIAKKISETFTSCKQRSLMAARQISAVKGQLQTINDSLRKENLSLKEMRTKNASGKEIMAQHDKIEKLSQQISQLENALREITSQKVQNDLLARSFKTFIKEKDAKLYDSIKHVKVDETPSQTSTSPSPNKPEVAFNEAEEIKQLQAQVNETFEEGLNHLRQALKEKNVSNPEKIISDLLLKQYQEIVTNLGPLQQKMMMMQQALVSNEELRTPENMQEFLRTREEFLGNSMLAQRIESEFKNLNEGRTLEQALASKMEEQKQLESLPIDQKLNHIKQQIAKNVPEDQVEATYQQTLKEMYENGADANRQGNEYLQRSVKELKQQKESLASNSKISTDEKKELEAFLKKSEEDLIQVAKHLLQKQSDLRYIKSQMQSA